MDALAFVDETLVQTLRASLDELDVGQTGRIASVSAAARAQIPGAFLRRLADLGFIPGESVRVLARAPLGGGALAVRIGSATFALRRCEAQCIDITLADAM